jgi:hypothetical protein
MRGVARFDSTRYGAAAALEHDIRSTSKIALNLAYTQVDFDDSDPAIAIDYDREDGFVRYNGKLRNIDYELDGGYSRLKRDVVSDESTAIGRATIQWQPTRATGCAFVRAISSPTRSRTWSSGSGMPTKC